jgi:hypothetical protein
LASRPSNNRGILPISSIAEIAGVAQLGVVVDPAIVFPPEFPYTTGNTKALRDNFVELYRECSAMAGLADTILLSTSARMTVHCWQISKRRAIE